MNLRHRVVIGQYTEDVDQFGNSTGKTWGTVAEIWANVEGLRGNQYFQAQQAVQQSDHKITIRYRKGISSGMIVRYDEREFTIQGPALDEDGKRRWLTLMCQEGRPV